MTGAKILIAARPRANRRSLAGRVRGAVDLLRLWRRRAAERRQLARFGERDMKDLALTPMDIERECAKPFWRE